MDHITWYTLEKEALLEKLSSSMIGLTGAEAKKRLETDGTNQLNDSKRKNVVQIFLSQFKSFMIWVLIAAALISGLLNEWVDSAIIFIVVLLNAIMSTVQENKAEAALEALKQMSAPFASVIREGKLMKVPALELVCGDIVVLEAGDNVPADLRIIECKSLKVEESALTGESVPVEKSDGLLREENVALGDRINMAYMGTAVTYGRGTGVVVATGMNTEMGKIAHQLAQETDATTPLQKKLNQISNILSIGVICIAAAIFGIGMLFNRDMVELFMTSVSLAVAAIPEGMVAVVTIVLAMGMQRMSKRRAIIRKMPAVETLGSTQVICSDKTGTLTLNRMTMVERWDKGDEVIFTDCMFHCNDSRIGDGDVLIGDPTETAILQYLLDKDIVTGQEIKDRVREGEIPFDSDRKLSSVVIKREDGGLRVFVKGAVDVLVKRCILNEQEENAINAKNEEMSSKALRVLAFGYKDVETVDVSQMEETESGLTFCGLVGMIDPPRPEAKAAIEICRRAGIRTVMITGDHKLTAMAIAKELGILDGDLKAVTGKDVEEMDDDELFAQVLYIGVYARVSPDHKGRIVRAWQRHGKIVAMTGDGVNDAPALKMADIGVGMGITGTEVSKGAADMVLTDDNFATIVDAVAEGRRVFDNIHKTVQFLLSSNVGEVVAMLIATLFNWRMLLAPHLLWINLVTDSLPALALGVEPGERGLMDRIPRDSKIPFCTKFDWLRIAIVGTIEAIFAILVYRAGCLTSPEAGMTMAFMTIALSQLTAAVSFYSERNSVFNMGLKGHKWLWLGVGGSVLLQIIVMVVPLFRRLFGIVLLSPVQWLVVLGACIGTLLAIELQKFIIRKTQK